MDQKLNRAWSCTALLPNALPATPKSALGLPFYVPSEFSDDTSIAASGWQFVVVEAGPTQMQALLSTTDVASGSRSTPSCASIAACSKIGEIPLEILRIRGICWFLHTTFIPRPESQQCRNSVPLLRGGAGTSFWSPELDRYYVAAPATDKDDAAILAYSPEE